MSDLTRPDPSDKKLTHHNSVSNISQLNPVQRVLQVFHERVFHKIGKAMFSQKHFPVGWVRLGLVRLISNFKESIHQPNLT